MPGPLTQNDVHIWYCYCDDPRVVADQQRLRSLLSIDELARYERFAFEKDRNLFLLARCLLRTALSQYAAVAPADWTFEHTGKGKPFLAPQSGLPPLSFNVSHSKKLAVCALTLEHRIGIDVESTARRTNPKVADYFLSPREKSNYLQASETDRRELFYRYWTLKEAYAKALGMGLSLRFTNFSFQLDESSPPALVEKPEASDAVWQFHQQQLSPDYWLALAVEGSTPERPVITCQHEPPRLD